MSGICGLWTFDGVTPDLDPILDQLKRRGPDGTRRWSDGGIALGHTLLATTPEALVEKLPLTDPATGCTITADVRLDNREELIAALGLGGETRTIGDGELILRAYLEYGEDCPVHLLGDFAFVIWDPRANVLFCARDHMGMRQLIYHHSPEWLFAFSTEAEALVGHPLVPRRINEGRIADFLDDLEGIDFTSTFFEEVFRLPPAHTLIIERNILSLRRYWQLSGQPELQLDDDNAYAEAFLDVLTKAVQCRLRSAGPVGSMVSGGLDSSSVAAVAGRLKMAGGAGPLPTFSGVGPDSSTCIETRSILSVLTNPDLEGTTVSYDDLRDYQDALAHSIETIAEPFDGQMTLVRAVYLAAHRTGVKVMLDGMGADLALTNGNRIAQFLRRLRIDLAITEARNETRFWGLGQRPAAMLLAAAWAGLVPKQLRRFRQRLIARKQDRAVIAGMAGLTQPFAARIKIDQRRALYRRHLDSVSPTSKEYQLRSIIHPHTTAARERYDRIASAFAIEPRDPFLDLRVLLFCLSLPRAQLRYKGWTKVILRRAMAGILPEDVAWRSGKDHLGGLFAQALIDQTQSWRSRSIEVTPMLESFSANRRLRYESQAGIISLTETQNFIELFSLGCWLSRHDMRSLAHSHEEK
ncbi:MAG: asparagine synthase-related protein [Pseudomonadota bacterium]